MNLKINESKRLKPLFVILIYFVFLSPVFYYYEQVKLLVESFVFEILFGDARSDSPAYIFETVLLLVSVFSMSLIYIFINKPAAARSSVYSFAISLKSSEISKPAEEYLNYKYFACSLIPGFRRGNSFRMLIAIIYFSFSALPALEGNYSLAAALISIPFIILGIQGIVNPELKKIDFKLKIAVIICFSVLLVLSSVMTAAEIKINSFKSPFIVNLLCRTPEVLKKYNINIEEYYFYNTAMLFGRENPLPHIKMGLLNEKNKDTERAMFHYQMAVAYNEDSAEGYFRIGMLLSQNGDREKALKMLKKAQTKDNSFAPAFYESAGILLENGDFAGAEKSAQQALRANSSDPEAYRMKAKVMSAKKRYEDSINNYNIAIELNPRQPDLYVEKAKVHVLDKKYDDAASTLKKALSISPNDGEANYAAGYLYLRSNDFSEAVKSFKKAQGTGPIYMAATASLAITALESGDFQKAKEEIGNVLKKGEKNAEVHYANAYIRNEEQKFDEALQEIQAAISLDGRQSSYYSLKAQILLNRLEVEKVQESVKRALELYEKDEMAIYVKAQLYLLMEDYAKASEAIETVIELNPYYARAYAVRAVIANKMNDRRKSDESLDRAMDIKPWDYYNYYVKSMVYTDRKLYLGALTAINKALEINNSLAGLYLQKYEVLGASGTYEEAAQALGKAATLNPGSYFVMLTKAGAAVSNDTAFLELERIIKDYPYVNFGHLYKSRRFLAMKRYSDALKSAEEAVNVNGISYMNYLTRYIIYSEMGMASKTGGYEAEMLSALNKLTEVNKFFPDAYYFRGLIYYKQKKYNESVYEFNKSVDMEFNYFTSTVKKSDVYMALYNSYKALGQNDKAEESLKNVEKTKRREEVSSLR